MTARITIAQASDAEAVAAIYRPIVEATAISFEAVPPSTEDIARRILGTLPAYPWLVCEIDGRIAGYAYAARHRERAAYRWSVDTSVYIAESDRRCGVGRGLYLSLFAILAAQGYVNAFAGVTLPNAASVGLHESLGFEKVGVYSRVGYKFGAWHDVGWWQFAMKAHEPSPSVPLDIPTVQTRAGWASLIARGESAIRRDVDSVPSPRFP